MMPKRNTLRLDLSGFNELITKFEGLQGDVKEAVSDALEQAGETIEWDTKDAVKESNLPANGKYSKGDTEKSIVEEPKIVWSGTKAEIGVGFNYDQHGAGGFLITGTPRMKPDYELQKIYKRKKYMSDIQKDMADVVNGYIEDKMGG